MTPLQRARHRHAVAQYRKPYRKPDPVVTPWGFGLKLIFAVLVVGMAGILLLHFLGY